MIIYLTYFISAAVILTKWFDCTSTLKKIQGIQMESNPIARALMYRLGIRGTVWFAFAVAVLVTVLSQLYVQLWTVASSVGLGLCVYGVVYRSNSGSDGVE